MFLFVTETVQGFLYAHAGVHFKEMLEVVRHSTTRFDADEHAFLIGLLSKSVNLYATNESDLSKGTSQGTSQDDKTIEEKIIEFCKEPRSLAEITEFCGFKDKRKFRERYFSPNDSRDLSATS